MLAKDAECFSRELGTNAETLMLLKNQNRIESEPSRCAVRDRYQVHRDVADLGAVFFYVRDR